ncbi:MAG: hypothetical protein IJK93_08045 [Muribaculaceae bacterium]|nr:hypothetical protein [Muribaculaceae bacterium]
MDTLITFAKENYELITLFVGLLGVIIAFIALIYELKARKRKKQEKDNPEE